MSVTKGEASLEAELSRLQQKLSVAEQGSLEEIALREAVFLKAKEIGERDKELANAVFEARKAKGEVFLEEELLRLQKQLEAAETTANEKIALDLAIHQKREEIADRDIALEEKRIELLKTQGQNVIDQEIALLERLSQERGISAEEQLDRLIALEAKKDEKRQQEIELEKSKLDLLRAQGEAGLADELERLQRLLAERVKAGKETIDIEQEIFAVEEQIAAKSEALDQAMFDLRKKQGKVTLEDELERLEKQLEAHDKQSEERLELEEKVIDKKEEIIEAEKQLDQELFDFRLKNGQASLEDKLDRLEEELKNTRLSAAERQSLELEVEQTKIDIDKRDRDLIDQKFQFDLEIGQKTLDDKLQKLQEELDQIENDATRKQEIEEEIHATKQDIAARDKALADELFAFRQEKGEVTRKEELDRLQDIVDSHEEGTKERIKAEKELFKKTKEFSKSTKKAWMDAFGSIIKGLGSIGKTLGGTFGKTISTGANLANDAMNVIGAFQGGIVNGVVSVASTALKWIGSVWGGTSKVIKEAREETAALERQLRLIDIDDITTRIKKRNSGLSGIFGGSSSAQQLKEGAAAIALTIEKGVIGGFARGFKGFLRGAVGEGGFLKVVNEAVRSTIEDAVIGALIEGAVIKGALGGLLGDLTNALAEGTDPGAIIQQIGAAIPGLAKTLTSVLTPLKQELDAAFGRTEQETTRVVRDANQSTLDDINTKIDELKQLKEEAEKKLEEATTFRGSVGRFLGQDTLDEAKAEVNRLNKLIANEVELAAQITVDLALEQGGVENIAELEAKIEELKEIQISLEPDTPSFQRLGEAITNMETLLAEKKKDISDAELDFARERGEISLEQEIEIAKKKIENTELTELERIDIQREIFALEQELAEEKKALTEEELEAKREAAQEQQEIDDRLFESARKRGEVGLTEEIARLQQILATRELTTLEQIDLMDDILDKENELKKAKEDLIKATEELAQLELEVASEESEGKQGALLRDIVDKKKEILELTKEIGNAENEITPVDLDVTVDTSEISEQVEAIDPNIDITINTDALDEALEGVQNTLAVDIDFSSLASSIDTFADATKTLTDFEGGNEFSKQNATNLTDVAGATLNIEDTLEKISVNNNQGLEIQNAHQELLQDLSGLNFTIRDETVRGNTLLENLIKGNVANNDKLTETLRQNTDGTNSILREIKHSIDNLSIDRSVNIDIDVDEISTEVDLDQLSQDIAQRVQDANRGVSN